MSAALLLDALRKHDLQDILITSIIQSNNGVIVYKYAFIHEFLLFSSLSAQGISKLDNLAQLSEADYSKLGIRSPEDKLRFLALTKDINTMRSSFSKLSNQSNDKTKPKSTEMIPRKRPLPSSGTSPDRKSRRMTIAPQTLISRTPPKITVRDRRLSYLPPASVQRDMYHRSPTKLPSPGRPKTIAKPKIMADEHTITDSPKQPLVQKASTRLLDAYGIPVNQKSRPVPTSDSPTHKQGSLEEFIHSKSKATSTSIIAKSSTAITLSTSNDLNQRIRVCVRKRPLNKKETSNQETDIAPLVGNRTIKLHVPKTRIDLSRETETHTFTFDDTFDGSSSSAQIYARTAQPLVEYVFKGGKATCFAHGQTGSGKTYTMLDPVHGLYVLAAQDIFRLLSSEHYAHLSASVGFYEIYQGQLFDLLNQKSKLTAREDGNGNVVIAGLREYPINNVEDLMSVFEYGNQGRTTGKTGANNKSSRSHAVLQILLKSEAAPAKVHGKMEGAEINKSLLALKECIRALDQNKIHTPFRGSKLTQVLKDSFTGDSRTCMIATISPNNSNSEHTLNTLRYADRVKELRGESDSRLIADAGENIDSADAGLVTVKAELETRDTDTQSVANSDAIWENDVSENLLEVDFPSNEVAANALATPTNDRYFHATDKSHRQEKYLKRLESPPAEIFDHIMEDPFFSSPLIKNDTTKKPAETATTSAGSPSSKATVSTSYETRIHRFIRLHRAQIKEMEECIRNEKKIIGKLSLTISSESDLLGGLNEDIMDNQQIKDDYENYLNDLDDIMDRKFELIEAIKDKIQEELE
ncbi:hypothetical protein [Parasitella parasitica]|uniref:Kinesin motor domain-containing protein n=1 Tax=Parasitella parasitica TaxID=35722 RepID=A0A0B7NLU4_9FUNG|nr:hypothetical protein [Parasitella parasitica]